MALNAFVNLVGKMTTTGLRLDTILRRGSDNLPVYSGTCVKCGTAGIAVPHRKVRQESVYCPNARCRGIGAEESRGTTSATVTGGYIPNSARSQVERRKFEANSQTSSARNKL